MTTQVQKDIILKIREANTKSEPKVIRVNTTLNKSESKILMKFCETLGLKEESKSFYSTEMTQHVQEYFTRNPDCSVLFIFEDIDYYVETTKQVLLYKILDMLQYC